MTTGERAAQHQRITHDAIEKLANENRIYGVSRFFHNVMQFYHSAIKCRIFIFLQKNIPIHDEICYISSASAVCGFGASVGKPELCQVMENMSAPNAEGKMFTVGVSAQVSAQRSA
ncbi:MAG: hypothetical protein R3E21_09805 [Caenibius sp.]